MQQKVERWWPTLTHLCRKKIFLTFIGGGAFGNPIEKIVAEIIQAHTTWAAHPESRIEKVVIVMFSPLPGAEGWLTTMKASGIPCSYVQYAEGQPHVKISHM